MILNLFRILKCMPSGFSSSWKFNVLSCIHHLLFPFFFYIYASESYLLSMKSNSLVKILHLSCQWWSLIKWYRETVQPLLNLKCSCPLQWLCDCILSSSITSQGSLSTLRLSWVVSPLQILSEFSCYNASRVSAEIISGVLANINIFPICCISSYGHHDFNTLYGMGPSKRFPHISI